MHKAAVAAAVGAILAITGAIVVVVMLSGDGQNPALAPTPRIDWQGSNGVSWVDIAVAEGSVSGFETVAAESSGVAFTNKLEESTAVRNQLLMNGSGVCTGDFDGDGWTDVYFCGLDTANRLYRNVGGLRFEDVTAAASVECDGTYSTGCSFVDLNGDGRLDLWVTANGSPNRLFINQGNGKFRDDAKTAGLESSLGSTTSAFADIDLDGDIDIYVCNYRTDTVRDGGTAFDAQMVDGELVIPAEFEGRLVVDESGLIREYGEEDCLYLNNGDGTFDQIEIDSGRFIDERGAPVQQLLDWGLTAQFQDLDNDGDPDLYVCNDFWSPDRVWINDGKGYFTAASPIAFRNTSTSSMSVAAGDANRDGNVDLFVTDMLSRSHTLRKRQMGAMKPTPLSIGEIGNRPQYMRNTFFLSRGDNTYAEIAQFSGLDKSDWSWASQFLDIDLDGNLDLLVTTGHVFDVQDSDVTNLIRDGQVDPNIPTLLQYPRLETPNYAFRNDGHLHFEEHGADWGFSLLGVSHGLATADFDNDGDIDLVVNNLNAPASILRNRSSHARVGVRLVGDKPNVAAIGARVLVEGFGATQQWEIVGGGQYLSGSSNECCFACEADSKLRIRVQWPSGKEVVVADAVPNRIYRIAESAPGEPVNREQPSVDPLFEDASAKINHVHVEAPFDDFVNQSLLPNRFSQLGPGIAWYDVDRDGRDDLLIGAGRTGYIATYRNLGNGDFENVAWARGVGQLALDTQGVVAAATPDGGSFLVLGVSSFEDVGATPNAAEVLRFDGGEYRYDVGLPGRGAAMGPVSIADVDGDGDLDVFVGGRVIPDLYPRAASSCLFEMGADGTLEPSDRNAAVFKEVGLVSASAFTDFDGDGDADLLLAVEWGPVKLLENRNGTFVDVTAEKGIDGMTGWWLGVATGDFDEDGRVDFIATNWGLNSKYHLTAGRELRIFAEDFDENGTFDIVETHYDHDFSDYVPERGLSCSSSAMPFLKSITPTYEAWGSASLEAIYGKEKLRSSYKVGAKVLEHVVFLNRGDRYETRSLPLEAQLAPALGVNVADFDGDGHQDLYLAQNFFAVQVETSRLDAGRGLVLLGDGDGDFTALTGAQSGLKVYGEQRGSAVADYDSDGRMDLVTTQNGARTVLLRNVRARPALRVRLEGPTSNPTAVGAQVRAKGGPWFEVQAGSGYLSQNSATVLVAADAAQIEVRWPGGTVNSYDIADGAKQVVVRPDGTVQVQD